MLFSSLKAGGSVTENTSICIIPDVRIDENTARNWKLTLHEAISRLLSIVQHDKYGTLSTFVQSNQVRSGTLPKS